MLTIALNLKNAFEVTDADRQEFARRLPGVRFELIDGDKNQPVTDRPGDFDVLVTYEVPRDLSAWTKLRLIQLISAGVDHLADHPVWQTPVKVANASGIHALTMAQYSTCAVLMIARRMLDAAEYKRSKQFSMQDQLYYDTQMLPGRTAGILGYGSIGRLCAQQLHALGMKIVAMKRDPSNRRDDDFCAYPGTGDPQGTLPEKWFGPRQLREMLPLCDALIVAAPATADTRGMVGAAEIALMPKGACVVVISRGGLVDEPALADALNSGHLRGAAVDCFSPEPPREDHPLFTAPGAILTPHISGGFPGYWEKLRELLVQNVERLSCGDRLLNLAGARGY